MMPRGRSRPEPDARAPPVSPRRPANPPPIAPPARRTEADRAGPRPGLETRFAQTPDFTLGVEEELVLVDPDEGSLVERPPAIEAAMAASGGRLQAEVFRSTVETTTPVCGEVAAMAEEVRRLRAWVVEAAEDHGLRAAATGTHPFARWEAERTTPSTRFEELIHELQLPMMSDLVFGQHVHVSVGSPEEAIRVTNDLQPFVPLLLALSANAPFWRGMDTGLASARTNVSAGMPRSGPPPAFDDWEAFQEHVTALKQADAIEDVTKLWWDVRPRPGLGTVEVRIADLPTDVEVSIALAALTQALVAELARRYRDGRAPLVSTGRELVRENRWRALRSGLQARFVERGADGDPHVRSVGETFDRTLALLAPAIDELGLEEAIEPLRVRIEAGEGGAERQRRVYQREGMLDAVVRDLADRTPP